MNLGHMEMSRKGPHIEPISLQSSKIPLNPLSKNVQDINFFDRNRENFVFSVSVNTCFNGNSWTTFNNEYANCLEMVRNLEIISLQLLISLLFIN